MDVSEILERVRIETTANVRDTWRDPEPDGEPGEGTDDGEAAPVRFTRTGWIQQIDFDGLLDILDEGATLRLATAPGRYAIAGTVVATICPAPVEPQRLAEEINEMIVTGATRTMQQDASYGLRQLSDVALKALSPGINDPTTAQDAIFHSTAVLAEMLRRDPPQRVVTTSGGRRLIADQQPTAADLVRLAFDETRRAAANQPTVCVYLLEALELLAEPLAASATPDRAMPILEQASLLLEGCRTAALTVSDLRAVEDAERKRFGPMDPASSN